MIDETLYRETFSRLRASEEAKKEVFQMKENNQKRARVPGLLRTAAIAAAMACALAVTAGAANLATDGALFQALREVWSDGYETRYEGVDEAGNQLDITVAAGTTLMEEDGRLILHAVGEDIDITDDLAENGAYHFEKATERRTVAVDIVGTPEDWTLTEDVTGEDGVTYSTTYTSGDQVEDVNFATAVVSDSTDGEGVENVVTVTTSSGELAANVADEAE